MGDRTRKSPVRFSGEFETRSPRRLPADQGQETGTGLTGWRRADPEPAKSEFSPAHQAQDLPGHPDFQPLLLWSRGRSLSRDGLAGSRPEIPFLSLGLTGIPLNFGIHVVQSSARKPSRNDEFSSGLAAFWFLWSAGGSVAPQCRRAGFSSAIAL